MTGIKTCLILLIVLSFISNEQITKKAKNVLRKDVCSKKHLNHFKLQPLVNKDTFSPKESSKAIKEICPTLNRTCCSLKNVQQLRDSMLQWIEKRKGIYTLIPLLKEKLDKLSFSIEYFEREFKTNSNEKYWASEALKNIKKQPEFFKNWSETAVQSLNHYYSEMDKIFSGFGCQICSSNFFVNLKFSDSSRPKLMYKYENISDILDAYKQLSPFRNIMLDLGYLIEFEAKKNGINSSTLLRHFYRSRGKAFDYSKSCPDLTEVLKETKACMRFLSLIGFFNEESVTLNMEKSLSDLINVADYIIEGKKVEYAEEFISESCNLTIFPYKKETEEIINDFDIAFTDRDGIKGKTEAMVLVQKSSSVVVVILVSVFSLLV